MPFPFQLYIALFSEIDISCLQSSPGSVFLNTMAFSIFHNLLLLWKIITVVSGEIYDEPTAAVEVTECFKLNASYRSDSSVPEYDN